MSELFDIAVLGSGFAGSLLSMIAKRLGYSVVLIERGSHPRFTIGESSTPLCNLLLDELVTRYDLPSLKPLTKWGSWQRDYPQVGCGLKRGFSFFHHDMNDAMQDSVCWQRQMLVAASPHDEIADTHWFRADFDELFVKQAEQLGVVYHDEVELTAFDDSDTFVELSGVRAGCEAKYKARFVVDATGPRGSLHRLLRIAEKPVVGYPKTQALYSHFSGIKRLDEGAWIDGAEVAPYPVDAAAVHHVFDGGWIWVLQFNNGLTSAGVAATDVAAQRLRLAEGAPAWRELVGRISVLNEQFAHAVAEQPFTCTANLCFRSAQTVGDRWAMLPSAAGFIDPLFSTGFPLTLLGVKRIAEMMESDWSTDGRPAALRSYAAVTDSEFTHTANLVAALYANMANFPVFRALSLLYFTAASYSELVKRLGKPELARSFLLQDDPGFGSACRQLFSRAQRGLPSNETDKFIQDVMRMIEPFDVAGFAQQSSRHCYPVNAEDALACAWKVHSTREEVASMLERSGFSAPVNS